MNTRRTLWLPNVGSLLWLAFFLGLTLTQWRLIMINADGDACLHWRIGNWMIDHRAVIHADAFLHTRAGASFITKEWLAEVLFAAAGDVLDWNGIVLLSAALIATYLWLLHRELLAEGSELISSTALTILAAMSCSVHWLARPLLYSHLFTVIFTWQLRLFDRGQLTTRQLLLRLAPVMVLWVNLHGAFFTGFVIIATFFMGNTIVLLTCPRGVRPVALKKLGSLAAVAVACMLATLLNPNGWRLPAHILEFFRDPLLATYTTEFRSPDFHWNNLSGFSIELAALAVTLIVLRPALSATDVAVVGTWGLLSLLSARNGPVFALVVTPILAEHLHEALTKAVPGRCIDAYRRLSAHMTVLNRSANGWGTVVLVSIVLVAVMAKPKMLGGQPLVTSGVLSNRFPVAATQFVDAHPAAVSGEMYNTFSWGGYLILYLPAHKVFVDGRNDFYGMALIREWNDVDQIHQDWDAILKKYRVGWTILPRNHALNSFLALRTDWRLAYEDDVADIYTRRPE